MPASTRPLFTCVHAIVAHTTIFAFVQCLPESDDPLAAALFATLVRLMKSSQQEAMQIAAEYDLTLSQLRILFTIDHRSEPLSVGELSTAVDL